MKKNKFRYEHKTVKNEELGYSLTYFNSKQKNQRIYTAKEILNTLGYKGSVSATLGKHDLEEGIDMITIKKKDHQDFFNQLTHLKCVGSRTSSIIMLYESGVNKLLMNSKKPIGVLTKNWLAREVMPSINATGQYNISDSINNPMSELFKHTEPVIQIQNSKKVAGHINENNKNFKKYFNNVHLLVTNKTAKQIRKTYCENGSARDALRKHAPDKSATESVIDELHFKYGKELSEIENANLHKTLPPAFQSIYNLGIDPHTFKKIEK